MFLVEIISAVVYGFIESDSLQISVVRGGIDIGATIVAILQPTLTGWAATLALVAANGFVFFFGFSWGPVVWVLHGEMFPNRIRAIAPSVSASAQ